MLPEPDLDVRDDLFLHEVAILVQVLSHDGENEVFVFKEVFSHDGIHRCVLGRIGVILGFLPDVFQDIGSFIGRQRQGFPQELALITFVLPRNGIHVM